GIDLVIPDFGFLAAEGVVHGIALTHGHEDHIGGLPYLLRTVQAPVFGTPLTLGLARRRVEETQGTPAMKAVPVRPRRPVRIGPSRSSSCTSITASRRPARSRFERPRGR